MAISPFDSAGKAHFIAWDVDSGDPRHVKAILSMLPKGAKPQISWSGKKGWHVWLFPDQPIPEDRAIALARGVRARTGLSGKECEIFPQGKRSKCLKRPGQVHPKTGKAEVFVPANALQDTERYDTAMILEGLRDGHWRTPASLLNCACREEKKAKPNLAITKRPVPPPGNDAPDHELASREELARFLMRMAGRRPVPLRKRFRCILPGHKERRASAAFFRGRGRCIWYHDFHHEEHGTDEWLPLGVVYDALEIGHLRRLSPTEAARSLAELGLRADVRTPWAQQVGSDLRAVTTILHGLDLISEHAVSFVSKVVPLQEQEGSNQDQPQLLSPEPLLRTEVLLLMKKANVARGVHSHPRTGYHRLTKERVTSIIVGMSHPMR